MIRIAPVTCRPVDTCVLVQVTDRVSNAVLTPDEADELAALLWRFATAAREYVPPESVQMRRGRRKKVVHTVGG